MAACTDVKPVLKIGVLAPFEGLYRRTGYDALAAVRAAIEDTPVAGAAIIPLALDDGSDPTRSRRAAEKLLVDGDVAAIVGPLSPATTAGVEPTLQAAGVLWSPPLAPIVLRDDEWAVQMVATAANYASRQGASRLVLAGWTPGWPALSDAEWSTAIGFPAARIQAPEMVAPSDAVFWLGSPAEGADFLNVLRQYHPTAPFWLGPQGGDPVFSERAQSFDQIYWVVWSDLGYNGWKQQHSPSSPLAYLVYQATVASIQSATGQTPQTTTGWFVQAYSVTPDGDSRPLVPED